MAWKPRQREEKQIINGGNIYQNTTEIVPDKLNQSIHELYFGAYQNLIKQIGLHTNLEVGLHIRVEELDGMPYTPNSVLKCRIETIPIVEQEYRYLKTKPVIEPCVPYNRKCTLKERLKILFKGGL